MASEIATKTAKAAILFATAGARAGGSASGNDIVEYVADNLDVTMDLISEVGTGASKKQILTLLALKLGAHGNLLQDKFAKCGVSIATLSVGLVVVTAEGVSGVGIPLAIATAASVLSDFYSTYNDCAEPAAEVSKALNHAAEQTEKTWNALNTPEGAGWLMQQLAP